MSLRFLCCAVFLLLPRPPALPQLAALGAFTPDSYAEADAHVIRYGVNRDLLLDGLSRRFGVAVDTVPLRVPLRETFGGKAKGHGRHVKQSGGHGQYAVVVVEGERAKLERKARKQERKELPGS